jgi:cation diffusion facilitator CzcD-associated flavoprotein CzcO
MRFDLGAGASGICLGVKLREAGFSDFTILEKSDDVGGTWHDNRYPGACCDVPSHFYSFSFERKADWSRKFSPQDEIQDYFRHVVDKYGLRPHIRFGTEVASARFDESAGVWRLRTKAGEELEAEVLASGVGQLNRPYVPEFAGRESFRGTAFHSARWDHGVDLAGKRVAVIGNAASAVQFVPPVAEQAAHVDVFQRTPNYVAPRLDYAYGERAKWLFAHVPGLERLYRWWIYWNFELRFTLFRGHGEGWLSRRIRQACLDYLAAEIPDPKLRAALTPDYAPGCKRLLISDDYIPALRRENVAVVTSGIERIAEGGVVTRDGALHPADVIVYGTGFETTSFLAPIEIEGLGGRKLQEQWRDGAEAYLGVAVAGFPNLFLLVRPEHEPRPQLDPVHDRGAGALHRRVRGRAGSQQPRLARRQARGAARLQRRGAGRARRHRLGHELRQLVQDRVRQGHQQLEGLHARVLVADAKAGLERVHAPDP